MSDEKICTKCGKEYKDARVRKIHEARCVGISELRCEGCKEVFSNLYNLQRHKTICVSLIRIKDQQEYEEKTKLIIAEYEAKIKGLVGELQFANRRYDALFNESTANADRLYRETLTLKEKIKEQQDRIDMIEEENKQKTEGLCLASLELVKNYNKHPSGASYNSSTYNINNSQNQNNIFINAFDYAQCVNKIKPPNTTIFSIPDMVNLLFDSGFGNHIRTTDRSRNAMIWNKPDIGQIRDSNGNDLTNYLIDQFQDKIETQQEFVERELNQLIASDYPNDDLIVAKRKHIEFCKQFKNKDQKLVNKLRKEIGKRAKDVKDETIDEVKRSKFTKILLYLEKHLFPKIDEWITLSPERFGNYIGRVLSDHYWSEGASSGSEKIQPYILCRDDNKKTCKITHQELGELLSLLIFEKFSHKENKEIVFRLIEVWLKEKTIETYEVAYNRAHAILHIAENKPLKSLNLILGGMISYKQM
jgi:hypothetical protein